MPVYYSSKKFDLEKKIKKLEEELSVKTKELHETLDQTCISCPHCQGFHIIGQVEAKAHMYYVDNVYNGYYAVSEYSYECAYCKKRVREYDDPELRDLRNHYKIVRDEIKE